MLGTETPNETLAKEVINAWHEGLETLTNKLKMGHVKDGGYAGQALEVWRDCIRE
jgi:hypothetical protein